MAEAFPFQATSSGAVNSASIYLDQSSTANQVMLGIYSDDPVKHAPASLLGSGVVPSPSNGAWNTAMLASSINLVQGQQYWLSVFVPSGSGLIAFRDEAGTLGQPGSQTTPGAPRLNSLPSTWTTGIIYSTVNISANVALTSAPPQPVILVGDGNLESHVDSANAGTAEAFPYVAAGGAVNALSVYLDATNSATQVQLGLYADNATKKGPGQLLGQVTIPNAKAGAWNVALLPSALTLNGSQRYWIAILGASNAVTFRDVAQGDGRFIGSQNNQQGRLGVLPTTWSAGRKWQTVELSAYAASVDPATLAAASGPVQKSVAANP